MWRLMPDPSTPPVHHRRWAVTGATGLLGNNLVRTLANAGADVRVLARGKNRRELEGVNVDVVEGDLDNVDALRRCFERADVVVHAAAAADIRYGRREEMAAINVGGTRNVVSAMPAGARLVHVSSVDGLGLRTLGQPADEECAPKDSEGGVPYVDTKREADRVVRAWGGDHVIVHPCLLLGPWDWKPSSGRMILAIARGLGRFPPTGGNNFVHAQDVVDGTIAAASGERGRAWILAGENLPYTEAWRRIAAIVGAPAPMLTLPPLVGTLAAAGMDLARAVGVPEGADVNAATTRMGFLPHYFDGSRARRELGTGGRSWEAGVSEAWAWFQAQRGD